MHLLSISHLQEISRDRQIRTLVSHLGPYLASILIGQYPKGAPILNIIATRSLHFDVWYDTFCQLLEDDADIDEKDRNGWTALHVAAHLDLTAIVSVLILNGSDITAENNEGDRPLQVSPPGPTRNYIKVKESEMTND